MKSRIKLAIKCLLGRSIYPPVTSHEYHIFKDDITSLSGKRILVTGGTGAIGSAICYELSAMGAMVGICGRNESKIKDTIDLIMHGSPTVAQNLIPVVLDVNNDNQIEESIKGFTANYGHLDVLVNNAGGQSGRVGSYSSHLFKQDVDQLDLVLDTNLRGVILCSRIACQIMSKQKFGHIISMGSVIGTNGKAGFSEYAAAKAGIIGFSKSLALEMAEYNVRVNCISPGSVNQIPFDGGSDISYTILNPLHRAGYTKEVADCVTFLIKNEFINGQNIIVDGGRSIGLYGDN